MSFPWEDGRLVWSRPAPGSSDAYREDEIVSLWTTMYTLLLTLNCWKREDMIYPPGDTGRHVLDRQRLLNDKGMSPEAVSLVERLPYPRVLYDHLQIHTEAEALNYLEPADVDRCSDPHYMSSDNPFERRDLAKYLLPQDVTLALPYETGGIAWILDLEHNAFRFIRGEFECPGRDGHGLPVDYPMEHPEDEGHYRNWPMYHAPTALRTWIRDLMELKMVPAFEGSWWYGPERMHFYIKGKALRQYGWPDRFRGEDWARDDEQIDDKIYHTVDAIEKTFDAREFEQDTTKLISSWKEDPDKIPDVRGEAMAAEADPSSVVVNAMALAGLS